MPRTLRRTRRLSERDTNRGVIISAQNGPSPNMTNGLRNSRYESRPRHDSASYSATVSVWMSPTPRRSRSPAVAWWIACLCRQLWKGIQSTTPRAAPSVELVRFDRKNEPWAQSWKTMNVRIRNPAAGTARISASAIETREAK